MKKKRLISILCLTFNHEKYIEQTLKSLLAQRTDFSFEIIIHDDCSTDSTISILKKYKSKYPDIIKLIIQEKNLYSEWKLNYILKYMLEKTEWSYIAFCEGDDYWISKNKLQSQVSEMQKYPEIWMSFHPAVEVKEENEWKIISRHNTWNKIFSWRDLILWEWSFCPTASMIVKKEKIYESSIWDRDLPVLDYFIQVISGDNWALYIDVPMSAYRIETVGSWTQSVTSLEKRKKYLTSMIQEYENLNMYMWMKFNNEFSYITAIKMCELAMVYFQKNEKWKYRSTINKAYNKNKIKDIKFYIFYLLSYFPQILRFLLHMKGVKL